MNKQHGLFISYIYRVNINHKQSVHIPVYSACVGIGNDRGSFQSKLYQALLTNECPIIFCSWPQSEGKRKVFLEWKSIDFSYELSHIRGVNVNYYKKVHHPIPTRENRENPGNFQNKLVSKLC